MTQTIDKMFDFLVSRLSGAHFEELAKRVFSAAYGEEFVPAGGMHDGAADGFLMPHVCVGTKPGTFFQFSVTDAERARVKVDKTITGLRKAGRDPKVLIYATNEHLPKQDVMAAEVYEEFGLLLQIRDYSRLQLLIRENQKAEKAFLNFFSSEIHGLVNSAKALRGAVNKFVDDPTVFAFLDFELRDRFSRDHLNERILDSLIYWSLRDTDPDKKLFKTRFEIVDAIEKVFPKANSLLIPLLDNRLAELTKRDPENRERIRYYKAEGHFCLPFEMRTQLAERSVTETELQDAFRKVIQARLKETSKELLSAEDSDVGGQLIFDSIHEYFVEQGLILSAYLNKQVDSEKLNISDQIVEDQVGRVIAKSNAKAKISPPLVADCMRVLRRVFYEPSDIERAYLSYLCRTSLLFMTLQSAPRIVEYFNQMGGNFRLLVGTDMLIKAISEQHLPEGQRQVEGLLKACGSLGAELILTEPVLREVFTHLHAADLEYRNHYLPNEAYLSSEDVGECDRILIRAYYYSRMNGKVKVSWDKFIQSLLDPSGLRSKSEKAVDELRGLLIQRFRMEYKDFSELEAGIDGKGKDELTQKLIDARPDKNKELSENDALMAYAVYALRRRDNEKGNYDGFGFRTWWLTKETKILSLTAALVVKESGVPYIMRPEFLLNYITLAPKAAHVRELFRELLPTTVGLQLGQHLKSDVMHDLLKGTAQWADLPPERVSVMIAEKVNKLKFDRFKQYSLNI